MMKTLILSDIHGNLPALEAILSAEGDYDTCLFLGDVVDYGPFPKECIMFLVNEMDVGVLGNHDNALAHNVDCGCRGDFKQFSEETRAWHRTLLDKRDLSFLSSLQPLAQTHIDGETLYLAHATPRGNLFQYLQEHEVDEAVEGITAEIVLLGHTHVQFKKYVGRTLVANPGSVGLARDGGSACYAVLSDGKLDLRRIDYNVEKTIEALNLAPVSRATKDGLARILRGEKVDRPTSE
jgi:putative phosphoesterase